jgi:hypothetical protein
MISPSRKIVAIGIICIALVGSVAYVEFYPESEASKNGVLTTIELPEIEVPIYAKEDMTDTDGDGLKDWQEAIQGTNPENPDTDGDGINDSAEVDAKSSAIAELKIGTNELYSKFVPKSLTDNLSKNLLSDYLQVKKQGVIDEKDLANIASNVADDVLARNELVEKFTISSVGTFADSDIDAGRAYGESFGNLYIKSLESIQNGSNDLNAIANVYEKFARDITAIYVPASLASTQVAIGNNFYNVALMFSLVANYEKDPVRSALALKNLKVLLTDQPKMFTSVANYFRRNGILFENQNIQRLWENI